jgi:hypothetical protein
VDLATGVIRVERGWDQCEGEVAPKSKQGRRRVPIPAALRDRLVDYLMFAWPMNVDSAFTFTPAAIINAA